MTWVLAQGLDAREAFPLSTEFRLARLFEANTSINRYSKTYIKTYCKHHKTLHCLPCCFKQFTKKYLDLRDTKHANQIFNKLYSSSLLIGFNYMMQELKHDLLESSKQLPSTTTCKITIHTIMYIFLYTIYHI